LARLGAWSGGWGAAARGAADAGAPPPPPPPPPPALPARAAIEAGLAGAVAERVR
jgi:hypothetical protein